MGDAKMSYELTYKAQASDRAKTFEATTLEEACALAEELQAGIYRTAGGSVVLWDCGEGPVDLRIGYPREIGRIDWGGGCEGRSGVLRREDRGETLQEVLDRVDKILTDRDTDT